MPFVTSAGETFLTNIPTLPVFSHLQRHRVLGDLASSVPTDFNKTVLEFQQHSETVFTQTCQKTEHISIHAHLVGRLIISLFP